MKTNFVIPSWSYWKEPLRAQPLTQLYLATILEEKGIQSDFTDFRAGPRDVKEADIYFYTVASPDLKETRNIAFKIREKYPNSIHVAGGPHPTIQPEMTFGFETVVVGKGEEAILQIIRDYPNVKSRYQIEATGSYPFPRRHFIPKKHIVNDNLFKTDKIRSTTAQFSFGCPFSCSFCANYGDKKIRRNSLEQVSKEIDYLKSGYGIEGLSLQDEIAIPLNPTEAEDYLDMLTSKDIKWRGQIRVLRNKDILRQAKESGLVELSFGLESVDQRVLDMTHKHIDINNVEYMIKACKELDIKTRLYLLNGLPGERNNIVKKTKQFIDRNEPDVVLLSSLQPYPGSPIAENPKQYNIKYISKNYDKFNHILCRYENSKDDIENAVPYEFEKGKGLSRKQIMNNLLELQDFLRERGLNK